jgi:hypothetical protein
MFYAAYEELAGSPEAGQGNEPPVRIRAPLAFLCTVHVGATLGWVPP